MASRAVLPKCLNKNALSGIHNTRCKKGDTMPKKSTKPSTITPAKAQQPSAAPPLPEGLPKDAQKKIEEMKKKLDNFQKKVVEKFDKYILGIALMPPPKPKEGEKPDEKVHVMTLVDDTDSKKMTKEELKMKKVFLKKTFFRN